MDCEVVKISKCHLEDMVEIHLSAFPNYFLSFLGPAFLKEFYGSFLSDASAIALVAIGKRPERPTLGFVVGTLAPVGFFKRLLFRRWWAFSLASMSALWHRPRIAPRLMRALAYRGGEPPGQGMALLSSIAVRPAAQHLGIGRILLAQWVEKIKREGARGCYLTTDVENNAAVNQFYLKAGWKVEPIIITPEGRRMNMYILDFN